VTTAGAYDVSSADTLVRDRHFASIVLKTAIVHTVTYSLAGLLALNIFDYTGMFADPSLGGFMRQTTEAVVASGPILQIVRGILLGLVFYPMREVAFAKKTGWLTLWSILVVIGIVSPFGAAPSSIEGLIYTTIPIGFHLIGLPEVMLQTLLLAFLTHHWVNHHEKKWLSWTFGVGLLAVLLLSTLGVLASLGVIRAWPHLRLEQISKPQREGKEESESDDGAREVAEVSVVWCFEFPANENSSELVVAERMKSIAVEFMLDW
jgi:hypothetical protein